MPPLVGTTHLLVFTSSLVSAGTMTFGDPTHQSRDDIKRDTRHVACSASSSTCAEAVVQQHERDEYAAVKVELVQMGRHRHRKTQALNASMILPTALSHPVEPPFQLQQEAVTNSLNADHVTARFASPEGLVVRVLVIGGLFATSSMVAKFIEMDLQNPDWLAASVIRHDTPSIVYCGNRVACLSPDALKHDHWAYVVNPLPTRSGCGWPHDARSREFSIVPDRKCAVGVDYVNEYLAEFLRLCTDGHGRHVSNSVNAEVHSLNSTQPLACCQTNWQSILDVQAAMAHETNMCVREAAYNHNEVQLRLSVADIQALIRICDSAHKSCHDPPSHDAISVVEEVSRLVGRHLPLLSLRLNKSALAENLGYVSKATDRL